MGNLHTIESEKVDKGMIVKQLKISQIESRSVFRKYNSLTRKAPPSSQKHSGLKISDSVVLSNATTTVGPKKEVLREMKVKGLKFFSLSDLTQNKISL